MRTILDFLEWLRIVDAQPDLAVAQFRELRRQIPLLYLLLGLNAIAVAYTHYGLAPVWMTVAAPTVLVSVSTIRLVIWCRRRAEPLASEAITELRRINVLGTVLGGAYVSWSLGLSRYGGAFEQGHVALFISITVIGCIFCLMHAPQTAIMVTAVVMVPYLIYYLSTDNGVLVAIALNILAVTAVMIQVLMNNYAGFTQLVRTRAEADRLNRENTRLAHTDALTGLPNRRHFFAELDARIAVAERDGSRFAVGLLDLDRFKPVNDTYGHNIGDRLLQAIGERLEALATAGIFVARLGGDEFGFLVAAEADVAEAVARRLCATVGDSYRLDEMAINIGCSCGIAAYPDAGRAAHALFDRADYALYHSKTAGRGAATLYSADHETRIRSERAIEAALQSADLEREMAVHFQPIVDATGHLVGVEALARWTSPTLGAVRPDVFVSVAERAGLIHAVTLALFTKALSHIDALPASAVLSFNLSAHDVTSSQTVLAVVSAMRRSGIDPSRLVFELTETAVMRDFDAAANSIRLLRSLGSGVALDDFGTGYSSLGHLHRMPIDKVKIDRSFVRGATEARGRKLLASLLTLCSTLDLECVVEGVEDEEQFAILRELGGRLFQGYLFARPMPPADLAAWLRAEAPARPMAEIASFQSPRSIG